LGGVGPRVSWETHSNLNTLLVHLMAINGLVGLVTTVVTLIAKYAFKYEDALFRVENPLQGKGMSCSKTRFMPNITL
jgi:hypothetical protein